MQINKTMKCHFPHQMKNKKSNINPKKAMGHKYSHTLLVIG